jgi:hypothetical protein
LRESRCDKCTLELERRSFIVLENGQAHCLKCAGLGHLVWLPAGDPLLTRRARAASSLHAVVLKWSRPRKRYERQGLLVEESALRAIAKELGREIPFFEEEDDGRL